MNQGVQMEERGSEPTISDVPEVDEGRGLKGCDQTQGAVPAEGLGVLEGQ